MFSQPCLLEEPGLVQVDAGLSTAAVVRCDRSIIGIPFYKSTEIRF